MNSVDSSPSESESTATVVEIPKISLYLFYEHYGSIVFSNSLYKIDLDLAKSVSAALDLPPTLEFKNVEPYIWRKGMRCARLGSKLYFLGGTIKEDCRLLESPRDVCVFDTLTGDFKKMDARLNAGKPDCVVFTGNGKVYALGSIPACPPEDLPPMMLFECFDPSTGKWKVLDDLPPVGLGKPLSFSHPSHKGAEWEGCIVLRKRQQVVVLGRGFCELPATVDLIVCMYHLQQGTWTKLSYSDVGAILSFQEGEDEDYLYGAPYICGPPVKAKRECISLLHEMDSYDLDGVVHMSIPGVPRKGQNYAEWVYTFFRKRYAYPTRNLVRNLGNGYFCYIATGMLTINEDVYDDGVEFCDPNNRGVTVTVFKEIRGNQGEELCFQAEILYSQDYVIRTPDVLSVGRLVECFVVDLEKMQKNVDKKKNDKKNKKKKKKKKEEWGNFDSR